jgi:hypothetical protein
MKQIIEILYPAHDGEAVLVTVREGKPVAIATPRTAAEAMAIHKALLHSEGQIKVPVTELASPPRLRRAWFTDRSRPLLTQEKDGLNVCCYSLDHEEACELAFALDDALTALLKPNPETAADAPAEKAVAA